MQLAVEVDGADVVLAGELGEHRQRDRAYVVLLAPQVVHQRLHRGVDDLELSRGQLQDLFPVAFLPENHALAVAIMSYNGGLDYGLLGDYDAMPDIDVFADGIEASLAELLAAARGRRPRTAAAVAGNGTPVSETPAIENGGPAPIVPADHGRRAKRGPAADMRAKRERGSRPARKRAQE